MKIGHGPATVINAQRMSAIESQNTCPGRLKLALFARESAAVASPLSRGFFILRTRLDWNAKTWLAAVLLLIAAQAAPARVAHSQPAPAAEAGNAARLVTDEVGRRVMIPAEVRRIVSLAPNLTETIYALGLADRLAGDTDYCDTPPAAQSKPHVGNVQNPSLEAIVALHPDLVLATTSINRVETADSLARLGIPVYTTDDAHTVRGLLGSIRHIAEIANAPDQGAALVAQLEARLQALHARLADRPLMHVLFVTSDDPLITIGQNTFIADALRWAGGESVILSSQNWPRISIEEVVRLQPDFIVLTANHDEAGVAEKEASDLAARPAWKSLQAVELGRVITVDEEFIRPAPGLIDEIEQLARALHPEVFAAENPKEPRLTANLTVRCTSCVL